MCPTEEMEEEMCQEERFKDMFLDIQKVALEEEAEKKRRAEIAFDYGTAPAEVVEVDSDSEDEPFEPPMGIKLPLGLTLPENQKQNHIIERTALFVVSKGPQMEIVIKAKQRNNSEQFGFLEFDNVLYPYYKYISKLIREKKYTPDLTKKPKKEKKVLKRAESKPGTPRSDEKEGRKPSNALAAIAEQHGSDSESDSDCELHPSLFARKRTPSPDILERNADSLGPRRKPVTPPPEPISHIRSDYDMHKSNDMYASLFKSLTKVTNEREELRLREEYKKELKKNIEACAPPPPDEEYREWWKQFYGTPCPYSGPQPMVPPPPDIEPVIASYASYIATNGAKAEAELMGRNDLQLHFMQSNSPHYSYYQHKVRYAQWEIAQRPTTSEDQSSVVGCLAIDEVSINIVADEKRTADSAPQSPQVGTNGVLNRKQRRRLQDAQKIGSTAPPGVFDPVCGKQPGLVVPVLAELPKIQSSPALLSSVSLASPSPRPPILVPAEFPRSPVAKPKPYVPSGPVSFSLAPVKEETKVLPVPIVIADDPLEDVVDSLVSASNSPAPPGPVPPPQISAGLVSLPPVPPTMLNNTQLDRKEKARIFMEKLLNEKKNRKVQEAEEQRIRELEQQKADIEKQLTEDDSHEGSASRRKDSGNTLNMIDELINSRIDNILQSNGLEVEERKTEVVASDSDDGKKKKKKEKKKKHKHKHDHKRSRSRSHDRESKRRRRRSGSGSDREHSRRRR